jgi:hypothetical protein
MRSSLFLTVTSVLLLILPKLCHVISLSVSRTNWTGLHDELSLDRYILLETDEITTRVLSSTRPSPKSKPGIELGVATVVDTGYNSLLHAVLAKPTNHEEALYQSSRKTQHNMNTKCYAQITDKCHITYNGIRTIN